MTRYRRCPFCFAVRMLYQVIDGIKTRICYRCFKVQQPVKPVLRPVRRRR